MNKMRSYNFLKDYGTWPKLGKLGSVDYTQYNRNEIIQWLYDNIDDTEFNCVWYGHPALVVRFRNEKDQMWFILKWGNLIEASELR